MAKILVPTPPHQPGVPAAAARSRDIQRKNADGWHIATTLEHFNSVSYIITDGLAVGNNNSPFKITTAFPLPHSVETTLSLLPFSLTSIPQPTFSPHFLPPRSSVRNSVVAIILPLRFNRVTIAAVIAVLEGGDRPLLYRF
ncbi:hypothetical protein PIB30_089551 [Stylosanthes scabra]|uniref:Uncharacterized protein n=1 Tax=Stylosanthes scabra TaxID=79078 RepID=A0ABU6WSG2_9FABA|nr:hypothetical protein [Stylosanthes scabra]